MQKGFAQLLYIFIVVILIFAGIYIYSIPKINNSLQSPELIIPKQSEIIDYNSPLGFQIKFTKDLEVLQDTEEKFNNRGNGDFRKNFKGFVSYEPGKFIGGMVVLDKTKSFDTNPFTVWVFDNPDDLSIDKWYTNYWYYPFVWGDFTNTGKTTLAPKQDATVSGQTAQSGIIDYQPGKPMFVYLSKDKKMYLFRIINDMRNIGDQILASLKFNQ